MSEENNKTIVRRIWEEIWQESNLATVDELIDPNHVLHAYSEDLDYGSGAEGFKRLVSTNRANLPDGQLTIEALIAEHDKVVTRYTLRMPTAMTTGDWDRLGFFRQLGIIPS